MVPMKEIAKQNLYNNIASLILESRKNVRTAVNSVMVITYWNIGKLIVEDEQQGKTRADYGKAVLEDLSQRLTNEFGKGFDITNLRKMRQFYILFPKRDSVSLELNWTHYRYLLKVESAKARLWYINETINEKWSTRALERQINSHYYELLFEEKMRDDDDNPTIGLLLCSDKSEAVAKYSVLKENKQLFASKYKLYLPTEDELEKELQKEIERLGDGTFATSQRKDD